MPKFNDISGQRFGKLIAIKPVGKNHRKETLWFCDCDCGGSVTCALSSLNRGYRKSCDCLRQYLNDDYFVGQKFGRLIVREIHKRENQAVYWWCDCECSNEVSVPTGRLTNGNTKSCGCYARDRASEVNMKDLRGQQFGRLTIIEFAERNKNNEITYICECECGNFPIVLGENLRNGDTQSCGCLQKEVATATLREVHKHMKGENHPFYNPNLTDEEREIQRNYPEYREWRKQVYERDKYTCQCCGQYGGRLNAHHIFNYREFKDLRTNLDNGITLCETCHFEFHSIYGKQHNTKEQLDEFMINKQKELFGIDQEGEKECKSVSEEILCREVDIPKLTDCMFAV